MTISASVDPQTLPTAETVFRYCLPSGAVLLIRHNASSPSVVINAFVRTGSAAEPSDRHGLTQFMTEMLIRGTHTRSAGELWESVESLGASLGVSHTKHTIVFSAKCLAEDTFTLLELLGDIQQNPTFPDLEIERVRGEMLTELDERMHSTRYVASRSFHELAFPSDHPYSAPDIGTPESVSAISRNDLVGFFEKTVPVRPVIIVIVGQVDPESVRDYILAHWENGSGSRIAESTRYPNVSARTSSTERHVVVDGKVQIDLVFGGIGPSRTDSSFLATNLANVVLGGFGLMGRLGLSVREEKGLAYYATTRLAGGPVPGTWQCIAGVSPEHYYEAVDTIRAEVERMCREPVPDEEFADCKSCVIGSLPLALESNESMAFAMMEIEYFDLGWDYLLRYPDSIASITQEDVMDVVRRYLNPATAILASAGPEKNGTEGAE